MCRLFGLLGNGVTPAEPWLLETDRSLLNQSNVAAEEAQTDGWGIGWFNDRRGLNIERGIGGASSPSEVDEFRRAAKAAHGPLAIAHLRKASNPMGLPKERLIALENSQPFAHGSTLFAHNGMIPFPRQTRALLGEYESMVRGVNDSEVLFWLLVRHLDTAPGPVQAFDGVITDLVRVWRDNGAPVGGPYSGLNVVFSRGPSELWAFCQYLGEHGTGLLDRTRPYYQMAYLSDAKQFVVGSEPFDSTRSDWRTLPNGHYLCAQAIHGLVAVTTGVLPAPSAPPRAVR
ncbi:MAG TPA: class II glutamine amidotransferase [Thermoplasmata archaeon]|nr:class II glutamine amidotransferase [Thermoplasmata archaeon]